MTGNPGARLALAVLRLAVLALIIAFGQVDFYPAQHTYGVSIGTDTAYVSAEVAHGSVSLSWQDGQ